jgi:hypothetical protein
MASEADIDARRRAVYAFIPNQHFSALTDTYLHKTFPRVLRRVWP